MANEAAIRSFQDFLDKDPDRDDFLQRGISKFRPGTQPVHEGFDIATAGLGQNLQSFGAQALPLGFATLNELLASQGKIDPRSRNRTLRGVARNTEAQQQQQRASSVERGFGGSGVLEAINAAIGSAGLDREAAVETDFVQQEEQRKRDDLNILLDLIINPTLQGSATSAGLSSQQSAQSAAERQAETNLYVEALKAIIESCWVARSIYGASSPKWIMARHYVMDIAPDWFRNFYLRHGKKIAGWLDRHTWAKQFVRPLFDMMVNRAQLDLAVA